MSRRGTALLLLLLAALGPRTAAACTPAVRSEVVKRAVTLMPPALARQLRRHEKELYAGALEGLDKGVAYSALEPGDADRELQAALTATTRLIDTQAGLGEVARSFGRVARLATDLSFALYVGPHDPRAATIHDQFCRYVERKLPRIVTTFGGYADPDLATGDALAFARHTAAEARRDYDGILRSYFPPGRKEAPQDFDDRSVAFASASLELSHALTRVARAWLFAWNEAHGDLTGTPFLERTENRP